MFYLTKKKDLIINFIKRYNTLVANRAELEK